MMMYIYKIYLHEMNARFGKGTVILNQRCSNGHIKLEGIIIKSMTRHQETPG